jgi:hypothetical protein
VRKGEPWEESILLPDSVQMGLDAATMMADTTAETNTAQPPAAKKAPLKKSVRKPGSKNLPA